MLVDINLLPQSKQRNVALYIFAGFLLLTILLVCIAVTLWYNGRLQAEESLESELAHIQEKTQIREQQNQPQEEATPTNQYESAVQRLNQYPLSTVVLLKEISELLTERGFVIEFEYSNTNQIHLVVQFDASREVAFFLERLEGSSYFSSVQLNLIDTVQLNNGGTEVLPRYRAEFQLTIDESELKKGSKGA